MRPGYPNRDISRSANFEERERSVVGTLGVKRQLVPTLVK